jgi:hypothetical protein
MKLTKPQRLILFSLGQFYQSINQSFTEKPLRLRTSKIAFIELLMDSKIISKQERALYKNLESLEKKKLIEYVNRKIKFTELGLKELKKVNREIKKFVDIETYFSEVKKPNRKLQTTIDH